MKIAEYVSLAAERGASDIHLIAGLPAKCRLDGQIVNLSEPANKKSRGDLGKV